LDKNTLEADLQKTSFIVKEYGLQHTNTGIVFFKDDTIEDVTSKSPYEIGKLKDLVVNSQRPTYDDKYEVVKTKQPGLQRSPTMFMEDKSQIKPPEKEKGFWEKHFPIFFKRKLGKSNPLKANLDLLMEEIENQKKLEQSIRIDAAKKEELDTRQYKSTWTLRLIGWVFIWTIILVSVMIVLVFRYSKRNAKK